MRPGADSNSLSGDALFAPHVSKYTNSPPPRKTVRGTEVAMPKTRSRDLKNGPRPGTSAFLWNARAGAIGALAVAAAACSATASSDERTSSSSSSLAQTPCDEARQPQGPTSVATPLGLALEVDNGTGKAIQVRAGQTFWLEIVDLRASIDASVNEGIDGLKTQGDFAGLPWGYPRLEGVSPVVLANTDGTFTQRTFFDGATWMREPSSLLLEQVDAAGHVVAPPILTSIGSADDERPSDGFFIRRLRAIQWTNDCVSTTDCDGATSFLEEALVEVRNAVDRSNMFKVHPNTAAFRLSWSLKPGSWTIPITQVVTPTYDYGFTIDIDAITPPGPNGYYLPGTDLTFRTTLRDGAGNRLHPLGSLPTYNEAEVGPDEAGIQYYRAFFDPTTTYWRRKHRERNMIAEIIGPEQDIQPIRSFVELTSIFDPSGVQLVATPSRDGMFAEYVTFPPAYNLFAGGAGWDAPVSDEFTYHLADDAKPGTYDVTMKGRRVYLGQDIPYTRSIHIQVGTQSRTQATLNTGKCDTCHQGTGKTLDDVLHANADRTTCTACHAPLGFEYDGPIYVRVHYIHARSGRYTDNLTNCASCHTDEQGIQRTSKSACLSCHQSYDDWHVKKYGPIIDTYVGGARESFDQCSSTCHTTHPGSHL